MPFVSRQQQKWGNSSAGVKALGGPAKVAEWNASTKGRKLPKRVATAKTRHNAPMPKHGAGHYMSTFGSLAPTEEE